MKIISLGFRVVPNDVGKIDVDQEASAELSRFFAVGNLGVVREIEGRGDGTYLVSFSSGYMLAILDAVFVMYSPHE